ncbi:hypothetical protein Ae406Ps2_0057c [Pseudonocardia sp. Ae406_Ps2]|nr:hypothetical protein Ae406Ps2_0057c [Pseudonocardia sp. Ae406_Ps2]OLM08150.1 hypothetical protein Ae331Ps2_5860 [Pseudonocardia sp. Ae331_Ps2]OLM13618.1 hypothetical protein Ae505Ps2_3746c [Pseudonocardia sp. Ae505_Ps2]OLM21625.1 hypothetical protein Ae706Ps2_0057c [Pseudonocardia sp. Ae706_Ps2]
MSRGRWTCGPTPGPVTAGPARGGACRDCWPPRSRRPPPSCSRFRRGRPRRRPRSRPRRRPRRPVPPPPRLRRPPRRPRPVPRPR